MSGARVAIVGATGAVGKAFLECLDRRKFPVSDLRAFASERSIGKVVHFNGTPLKVEVFRPEALKGIDVALFSAGSGMSRESARQVADLGAVVIDNSSAWRMDPEVPLIVPEVNAAEIRSHKGIIANPNCSTIQMVVALKPLHDRARVRRVIVSTYQAVSGAGSKAVEELNLQVLSDVQKDGLAPVKEFPHPIAFNAIPIIGAFDEDGATFEETKMIQETRKILGDDSIRLSATCVRIPVRTGHSESINIETEEELTPGEAIECLRAAPGIVVCDRPEASPTPAQAEGKDEVFVGRIRRDPSVKNGLALWVVADNLLKGAALNAVQIAEHLVRS